MRLLLGSGGFGTQALLRPWLAEIRDFLGPIKRILFIPFASADHDYYFKSACRRWRSLGVRVDGLHHAARPYEAVADAQAVFIGGGNTWRLLRALREMRLISLLRKRTRRGMPYLEASAGTNVACPTIQTTNDMPILHPGSFAAIGLVPFQINAHYFTGPFKYRRGGDWTLYGGETRDDRLAEFYDENKLPVVGLWEGAWLRTMALQLTLCSQFQKRWSATNVNKRLPTSARCTKSPAPPGAV
ncbi:MAG: dipeptidase PepE, partial [Elusimicrobia bacterium]|nr:dipeptidase PepE [Elusimicrobiota bacterium]